ncbi:MAG: hypothetical protein QOF97_3357 [Acidimicrobiaceae bacterium]
MNAAAEPAEAVRPEGGETRRDVLGELRRSARSLARATNLQDRWLLWAGSLLVPMGLLLIFLGYRGAAHAPRVIQQIPYEISGGILGLALVFAGGFSYFAWWLTQVVRHQDRLAARVDAQTETLVAELRSLREAIMAAPTAETTNGSVAQAKPRAARRPPLGR